MGICSLRTEFIAGSFKTYVRSKRGRGYPKKCTKTYKGERGFQGAYTRSCNFHKASQVNEIVH